MGKHLAPKTKHELKMNIKKPTRVSEQKSEKKNAAVKLSGLLPNNRLQGLMLVCAFVLLIVVRFLPLDGWMRAAAYAIPLLLAIVDPAADAAAKLRSGTLLNQEVITCLAAVLLFATGLFPEAVLLLVFFRCIKLLEARLVENSLASHAKGLDILPQSVLVLTENGEVRVPPSAVNPGDTIIIRAGERIPLDGVITQGITTVDTASVSGQRSPWAVNVGYKVYSGCRNLTSDIKVRVTRPYAQSTAKKIVRIAENALDFPSGQALYAARYLRYYTPAVLLLSLLIGVALPILKGGWLLHLRRAAVVMIAACGATELYSIPLLYRKALAVSARSGVFAKGEDCFESIARSETMIFDKTGTITEGRYAVTDVYPVKMSERQLLTIAATAESFSRHPIAAAIRDAAGKIDERVIRHIKMKEVPGRGVSAHVGDHQVYVGNAALLEENGIKYNIPSRPGTAVHVSVDNRYCGYILVTDKVRRRSFDALETLRVNGIKKLVLLTGDVLSVARPIASRLNFDMLRAELKPEDKARAVDYLMKNKGGRSTIAFVGEGENSGRIMSGADVGIAMGSLGSDVAMASADVLIMDRDIFKVPRTLSLSKLVYRLSWENMLAGVAAHLLIILFGMLGIISAFAAEVLIFAVCLAILGNTLRIK